MGSGFTGERRLTLLACILGSSIVFIDGTVVNVALPAIERGLNADLVGQQWVVEGYLLTLGSLILLGGSLGDLYGRRRVFGLGVALFGLTSIACAVAPSIEVLIGARVVQGMAGALLVPSSLALIVATFDERERGRAIGVWTAWVGIATVAGPFAGGVLIDAASWRWVFAINLVPVAMTLFLIVTAIADHHDATEHRRPDILGALLVTLGLGGSVFALIEQQNLGWSDPLILVTGIGGLLALALFIVQERRAAEPMLPLGFFRRRNFGFGNLATVAIYAGLSIAIFFLMIFLQQVGGYSALGAGVALMPVTVIMFFGSSRFGALADRYGPRLFMSLGPIVAGIGLLLLTLVGHDVNYLTDVFPGAVVFGFGLALTVAPLTAAVLAGVEDNHAGLASGVNNAIARVAGLVGIAVAGAVVASSFATKLDTSLAQADIPTGTQAVAEAQKRPLNTTIPASVPEPARAEFAGALEDASVDSFHDVMTLAGLLAILGGIVSALGIRNPRRELHAAECPGGAICGASEEVGRAASEPEPAPVAS